MDKQKLSIVTVSDSFGDVLVLDRARYCRDVETTNIDYSGIHDRG